MSVIKSKIEEINNKGEKVLSVFITSGFPDKNYFIELVINIFNAGADILEIGIPFSDPIADGVIIQKSSQIALNNGVNISYTFECVKQIRKFKSNPIILMGYANPILAYGKNKFVKGAEECGVNGLIIPDIPFEEQKLFFNTNKSKLDFISLIAPTTPVKRIKMIDKISSGFVYCISVNGITGKISNKEIDKKYLLTINKNISQNKSLVGFGITNPNDAKKVTPYCDGIIVGSAVIKMLLAEHMPYTKTLKLIRDIKNSLKNKN
ncbi:MAG: tryptophan synthase subunit alpha [Ignavibacteriales bacterium CG_4_9_14_3_um_filter_30_11]|nr:MAG: tryptophan synthase subunit alpha [Ignavibacteriales bacterium CG_4_9_14_3_um_filter_30_11]